MCRRYAAPCCALTVTLPSSGLHSNNMPTTESRFGGFKWFGWCTRSSPGVARKQWLPPWSIKRQAQIDVPITRTSLRLGLKDAHSPSGFRRRQHHGVAGLYVLGGQRLVMVDDLHIIFDRVLELDG